MSNIDRSILSIIEPDFKKIILDEIFIEDSESEAAIEDTAVRPTKYKMSSVEGSVIPTIFINTTKFDQQELDYMQLNTSQKIPTISITIIDANNKFAISPPLDGDVISLYLRPPDVDNQKPIRIDFNVISISCNPSTNGYNMFGEMKVPDLYREFCKSFPDGTSFDHIGDVCEEMGLGYASNEDFTDDQMTRICAFDTYETFINDVVFSAYKNDESFFDWYIDPYYFLCFVNVNKQFSLEDAVDEVNISSEIPLSSAYDQADTEDSIKGSLVLTNQLSSGGKNTFIEKYSVSNQSGSIWLKNGYKRYGSWLNIESDSIEFQEAFVDPLTTPGAETDFILLKGRRSDGDAYKQQVKFKWMGKQSPIIDQGNVHDNYNFSKLLNHQNLEEIEKTTLEIEISGMNFYLYKYMRIPILIYETNNPKNQEQLKGRNEALGEGNDNPPDLEGTTIDEISFKVNNPIGTPDDKDQTKNEFLSGYYVIKDIKYTYLPGENIKTQLILMRREWPIPAKNKDS